MPRGPRGPIEKPKDRKKVLLRLWTYIYAHKWMALGAVLLTVASNLLALLGPMLSGAAIDAIGIEPGQADFPTVFFYCGLMIVFYAVSSLLSYILSILMIQLSQKIVFQMRQQVFDRLTQLPVRYFDGHQTGDIVSRISYDIDTVNASLSNDLLQIAASVITVVGSFIMMVAISPVLVLVFVITIPMSILFTRYMTKKVRPLFHQRSVKLGEMNGFVEEVITGQKTTKAYHQEETMVSRFDERNKAAVDAYYNADYYGGMTGPSVNFINNLSLAFVSIFGAILFLWGNLSIGNLSSFVLYSRRFSGPINEVANIISELQSACAAAERVFRLIDEEPEPADAPRRRGHPAGGGPGGHGPREVWLQPRQDHHPRFELYRAPRQPDGHCGPHRRGQDHLNQFADALLRPPVRRYHLGRPGHPANHPEKPAALLRHGAAGHLAVYGHHL